MLKVPEIAKELTQLTSPLPEKTLLGQIIRHQHLGPNRVRVAELNLFGPVIDANGVPTKMVSSINRFVSSLLDGLFDA